MKSNSWIFIFLLMFIILSGAHFTAFGQLSQEKQRDLHRPFDILLRIYVKDFRFDYTRILNNPRDLQRLSDYIDNLELLDPVDWSREDALAYWINLYNAATLELVLKRYPVKSIKKIGGLFSSPWKKKVVKVAGKELSLGEIEDNIIRSQFNDPRTHFAINNAAISCPPLRNEAFIGETLDAQLDNAVKAALAEDMWLEITDLEIRTNKVFDWHKKDFQKSAGSIREFISKYRERDKTAILDETRKLKYHKYNWDLNKLNL